MSLRLAESPPLSNTRPSTGIPSASHFLRSDTTRFWREFLYIDFGTRYVDGPRARYGALLANENATAAMA